MSALPPSSPALKTLSLLRFHLTRTPALAAHLTRLLSHTGTLDTTLLTLSYTLHLLHALLSKLPHPTPLLLTRLTTTLPPVTTLLSETRLILRLPALLSIYTSAWELLYQQPQPLGAAARKPFSSFLLAWTQLASLAVYQVLENGAFLAERGVLGWERKRVDRAWVWSSRAWMVYVGAELARLGVEWRGKKVREEKKKQGLKMSGKVSEDVVAGEMRSDGEVGEGVLEEKEGKMVEALQKRRQEEDANWWQRWKSQVIVNAAYAPMTLHYSRQDGLLSEGVIGALGCVVAWERMGDAWRACSSP